MLISLLSTIVYSTLFIRLVSAQNSNEPVDTSPDTCRCYCCPSIANPGGQIDRKCDPNNPPLTGTVPIGGGAGASACNPLACSGYFAAQCPPTNYASSRGAAVRAGCRSCPDGPYGNGTMAPGSGGSSIGNQIDNYENSGGKMKESGAEVFSETYYGFGILFFFLM